MGRYICVECGAGGGSGARQGPPSYHCHECPGRDSMWPEPQAKKYLALLETLERLLTDFESEIHNEFDGTSMLDDRLAECDYARIAIAKARSTKQENDDER